MREEIKVRLRGDIDHHSTARLKESLDKLITQKRPRRLVLDFNDVPLMDSAGIGLLIGRYKLLRDCGGELCVKNTSRQTEAVFKISGMYKIIKRVK